MNNFALFSAGGRDFVVLNLEWEAPQYALDWAAKVLAAYPDRIAVVTTHSFVGLNGLRRTTPERPGGTSADKMWTDFVSQQCSIKLVLSGHFHNGDAGEASRSDLNRCGQPVQQILSDYQDRPNGGDGWLRYYTFDPAANTMTARTYSPKLGTFENDADSAFTVPFEPDAAPNPHRSRRSGRTPSPRARSPAGPGPASNPNTAYEWRAVTSDGQTSTVSPTWTVTHPGRRRGRRRHLQPERDQRLGSHSGGAGLAVDVHRRPRTPSTVPWGASSRPSDRPAASGCPPSPSPMPPSSSTSR